MRYLVVTVFGEDEVDPRYETIVDTDYCLVTVAEVVPGRDPEYYDFRLQAPVHQHYLDEVMSLVCDLLNHQVEVTGGLQPALF